MNSEPFIAAASLLEPDTLRDMLVFSLGGYRCALEVRWVHEIRARPQIFPLIHAAPHVKGLMNFRGEVVPVWDLALRHGWPLQESDGRFPVLLVCGSPVRLAGCLVDGVDELVSVADDERLEVTRDHPLAPLSRQAFMAADGERVYVVDEALLMVC